MCARSRLFFFRGISGKGSLNFITVAVLMIVASFWEAVVFMIKAERVVMFRILMNMVPEESCDNEYADIVY